MLLRSIVVLGMLSVINLAFAEDKFKENCDFVSMKFKEYLEAQTSYQFKADSENFLAELKGRERSSDYAKNSRMASEGRVILAEYAQIINACKVLGGL